MISLVQRKARTGRDAHVARAMSLGRALRLTAAKQADQMMGLALGALSVTQKGLVQDDIGQQLLPDALMLLMDGPEGQVAAALLEPALVTGLIQQQTMGKVTAVAQAQAVNRASTATDAALCAPFVEALLSRASLLPEDQRERDLLHGYRFGVWAKAPRQVLLALEAASYEAIEMTLDLAAGTRAGKLVLLLPEPLRIEQASPEAGEEAPPRPADVTTLDKHVMEVRAELTIALTRLKLPLQEVTKLQVGDLMDLNISSMAQAMVIDASGRAITRGTLGQIDGMRAMQVEQQRSKQQMQPRRRASDRADLDLPDVTAPANAPSVEISADSLETEVDVPRLSDVDIFGDIDDLPDMTAMDAGADARMDARDRGDVDADEIEQDARANQTGW